MDLIVLSRAQLPLVVEPKQKELPNLSLLIKKTNPVVIVDVLTNAGYDQKIIDGVIDKLYPNYRLFRVLNEYHTRWWAESTAIYNFKSRNKQLFFCNFTLKDNMTDDKLLTLIDVYIVMEN